MKTAHNMQIVNGDSFIMAIDGLAGWLVLSIESMPKSIFDECYGVC